MKKMCWFKSNKIQLLLLLFLSLSKAGMMAQVNIDFYKKKYPNANEVVLKQICKMEMNISNNGVEVISENDNESLVIADNVNKVATKGSVSFSSFNQLIAIEASTELQNKKYVVKDYRIVPDKHSRSFHDDLKLKEFDYQQLGYGAIKKLNYKTKLTDHNLLSGELFIDNNPIEYKEFKIVADKDIDLGYKLFNNETNKITFSKEEKGNKIIYKWMAQNISQYKPESGIPPVLYYVPLVEVYIKSYKNKKGEKVNVLNTLSDLHTLYQGYIKNVFEAPSKDLLEKVQELKAKHTNEIDQVKEIYYWVKDNVKYIAFEDGYGGFIPRMPNDVFEKRYGDCKDMATLIYTMIRSAGIESVYLTWIGSREKPFRYDELPTQSVDDHMITTYQHQGKNYFLDGTSRDTPFGYPSSFIQGKQAFLHISKDKYELAMVPIVEATGNAYLQNTTFTIEGNKVKGMSKVSVSGFHRDRVLATLKENAGVEQTEFLKGMLQLGNNKFHLEKHEISDRDHRDKPLRIHYTFNVDNYVVQAENELYVNMFLFKLNELSEVNTKREVDYHLDNTAQIKQNVTFQLPKGYKINYIPENKTVVTDKYAFAITYEKKADAIVLDFDIKVNYIELKKEELQGWNDFLNLLKEQLAESVSIVKTIK